MDKVIKYLAGLAKDAPNESTRSDINDLLVEISKYTNYTNEVVALASDLESKVKNLEGNILFYKGQFYKSKDTLGCMIKLIDRLNDIVPDDI